MKPLQAQTPPRELGEALELVARGAVPWAGGTDLLVREQQGLASGPFVGLCRVGELRGATRLADGSVRIGAMTTLAELAGAEGADGADGADGVGGADVRYGLAAEYPALAGTAGAVATPQIRAVGTIGGNLLQRNRCSYFRNPAFDCHQNGGDGCPARSGLPLWPVVAEQGPCIAAHPSSLAVALLAHDAEVEIHPRGVVPLAELYGDGSDPTRDHLLGADETLLAVRVPAPVAGERSAHRRTTEHDRSEWPQVEAVARLQVSGGRVGGGSSHGGGGADGGDAGGVITFAAVAVGGVARTPLRLRAVEEALTGRPATAETIEAAAALAMDGRERPAKAAYKIRLLEATLLDVLERALLGRPARV